jgi:hypothetical protein
MTYAPDKIEVEDQLIACEATFHAVCMIRDAVDSGRPMAMGSLLHLLDVLGGELEQLREVLGLGSPETEDEAPRLCACEANAQTAGEGLSVMSKQPPVIKLLGKQHGVRRLSDENLNTLHDYALITLLQCQNELQRRGVAPTGPSAAGQKASPNSRPIPAR